MAFKPEDKERSMRHQKIFTALLTAAICLGGGDLYAQSHYATKQAQESYDSGIKLERQAEERGDLSYLEQAEKRYREAIEAEPNMVQAYIRLGYVMYALKRSDEGVRVLENALIKHSDNLELKHYLGLNLYEIGKRDEAEALLTEVVSQRENLPEAYFVLGKISLDKGDSQRAQEYFGRYAAATPDDAHAYRALSSAYIQANNVAGAESALSKLLELAPDDVIAKINMGHVKYERGQIDEAVKLYEQAYKAEPQRSDLLYTIASAYYLSGRYEEAIQRFAVVLEKDSTHMSAEYFTADSELKLGHLDKAEELFKALEKKMPDYRYIKLKLAYIRMLRGDSNAIKDVRELIKETTHPDDLHFGAVMLRKNGQVDESVDIHRQLREEHPENSLYGVYLAREYLEQQNYAQASDLLMMLIDENVNNHLAWEMLSLTLLHQGADAMMLGEFDQAHSFFDQALSMDIHTTQTYCSMSQLGILEGKLDEAHQFYQMAEQIAADDPDVVRLAAQFDIMDGEFDYALKRLKEFEKTQSSDALGGAGWYLMAVAQSSLGKWDDANQSLMKAEEFGVIDSPASAAVALHQAIQAYNAKNLEETDRQLNRVERFKDGLDSPDKVRYNYLSALSNIRAKRFSIAKSALESAQKEFNSLPLEARQDIIPHGTLDLSFELAYVYYETGNYEMALSTLNAKNGSKDERNLEAAIRRKLGYQALKSHKYETALENYNRLNALNSISVSDQYNLVLAKLMTQKLINSGEILEKYANQKIPEAVLNYAIYLDETGEGAKATLYYEKYVSMTSSRKSEDVRRMIASKQRVWGGD